MIPDRLLTRIFSKTLTKAQNFLKPFDRTKMTTSELFTPMILCAVTEEVRTSLKKRKKTSKSWSSRWTIKNT